MNYVFNFEKKLPIEEKFFLGDSWCKIYLSDLTKPLVVTFANRALKDQSCVLPEMSVSEGVNPRGYNFIKN